MTVDQYDSQADAQVPAKVVPAKSEMNVKRFSVDEYDL